MSKLTENKFDDAIVSVLRGVNWPFAIMLSILLATFTDPNIHFFQIAPLSILFILILIYHVDKAVRQFITYTTVQSTGSEEAVAAVHGLQTIISLLIWSSGFLLVLSTVGYNITSLVAGLGVGGLAVALALQNILSDVFSSFTIFFDKPFTVGDFIVVKNEQGTVKKIGLKTTRIQSLRGEEVIISNRELTESIIENFGKLERRRVESKIGFIYETSTEKLESIPEKIEKLFTEIEGVTFYSFHFKEFADSSLNFDLVYYVNAGDWESHIQTQHRLNLEIKKLLEKNNMEIAFPTQTVYVKK